MTRPLDLSVYLVTDPASRMGVVETVAAAVTGGVTLVQLRDKDMDDGAFVALGRAIQEVLAPTGVPLLVNDRVALVGAIGAAGAHIGQSDMDVEAARAILGPEAILGLSVQKHEQVRDAYPGVDYVGIGPVRATASKRDHAAPIGLDGFAALCARMPLPCVAIGGVTAEDAAPIKAAGGAGMSVVSAICAAEDPAGAARILATAWRDA
jgi:thiamine-phosphate pyrophosphorylase